VNEVQVAPADLDALADGLTAEHADLLRRRAAVARSLLEGRVVWNVNSTAHGGGVAEMLGSLVAYARAAHVDTRWLTISADPGFFLVTKRLHNFLHGVDGDGGELGAHERSSYLAATAANLADLLEQIRPGDVVVLHDPQTAGLVAGVRSAGALAVWRCHIGRDRPNDVTRRGWDFLREFVEPADAIVFSRRVYRPPWMPDESVRVIPPSVDPFSPKNTAIDLDVVSDLLDVAGLIGPGGRCTPSELGRRDGRLGRVRHHRGLLRDGDAIPADARLVLQVSRWDRLKDMQGVLHAFADRAPDLPEDVHLLLAGPDVNAVSDDPEGALELQRCLAAWRTLPATVRRRTHLACLPMDDPLENAYLVNALQRRAAVVVQKSLAEGFGLTVTEAMWKSRPVLASATGGIQDQIEDGVSGVLVPDPRDLDDFAGRLALLLEDDGLRARLGAAAHERVRDHFLVDRHLEQYVDTLASLLG
jgi:trehalose synthase